MRCVFWDCFRGEAPGGGFAVSLRWSQANIDKQDGSRVRAIQTFIKHQTQAPPPSPDQRVGGTDRGGLQYGRQVYKTMRRWAPSPDNTERERERGRERERERRALAWPDIPSREAWAHCDGSLSTDAPVPSNQRSGSSCQTQEWKKDNMPRFAAFRDQNACPRFQCINQNSIHGRKRKHYTTETGDFKPLQNHSLCIAFKKAFSCAGLYAWRRCKKTLWLVLRKPCSPKGMRACPGLSHHKSFSHMLHPPP